MEYNSSREELIIPEYGRHVQNMVRHARSIENSKERQQFIILRAANINVASRIERAACLEPGLVGDGHPTSLKNRA